MTRNQRTTGPQSSGSLTVPGMGWVSHWSMDSFNIPGPVKAEEVRRSRVGIRLMMGQVEGRSRGEEIRESEVRA